MRRTARDLVLGGDDHAGIGDDDQHVLLHVGEHLAHGEVGEQHAGIVLAGQGSGGAVHDADDLERVAIHVDPLADGVLIGEQSFFDILADDDDGHVMGALGVGEEAAVLAWWCRRRRSLPRCRRAGCCTGRCPCSGRCACRRGPAGRGSRARTEGQRSAISRAFSRVSGLRRRSSRVELPMAVVLVTMTVLGPKLRNMLVMAPSRPAMMEPTPITAPVPMITPSTVRNERILCSRVVSSASCMPESKGCQGHFSSPQRFDRIEAGRRAAPDRCRRTGPRRRRA